MLCTTVAKAYACDQGLTGLLCRLLNAVSVCTMLAGTGKHCER